MRTLDSPPTSLLDPGTLRPRVGSFRGSLPPIDFRPVAGPLARVLRRKRWIYAAIATDEAFVGLAIIHLGYATSCFAFTWRSGAPGLAFDRSAIGHPGAARIADVTGEGARASFSGIGLQARIERRPGEGAYSITARGRGFALDARLEAAGAPPPIAVIADLGGDRFNATEKRALLAARGQVVIGDRRIDLDGGLGGFDYTHGLLARRTRWRWAFALGRARSGEPVAFNLVEGFVGEPECGVWVGDALYPIAEGRFTYDLAEPLRPWRVESADGALDLSFEPGGMHAERKNLGLIASTFLQPVGRYRGTLRLPGRGPIELDGVPGVVEHQDVRW
ncbi:MAG: DUF2804 domain-containing protein [Nannocystaceae bacterium]